MASSENLKSLSGINGGLANGFSDKFESLKVSAERFVSDASPQVQEAVDQISEMAGDLYHRANTWVSKSSSRKYGVVAAIATVGVLAFYFGRGFKSPSERSLTEEV